MSDQGNRVRRLLAEGQSVWLDFISRELIGSGRPERLIDEDGLRGMTSNPSTFEKATDDEVDGIELFVTSFDRVVGIVEQRRLALAA